jgi:predicted dinucleotide-binding enzyme
MAPDRVALGVAGDDRTAVQRVADFIDRIGFDPVPLESLAAGRVLEPGGPVFGAAYHRSDFERAIRAQAA